MARVLLVEDHDEVHRLLCQVLADAGYDPTCVRTRGKAEAALQAGAYSLLVCDLRLPDGSGRDLIAAESALGVRTLVITGHPDDAGALLDTGIEHLLKPFRLHDFLQRVAQLA